MLTPGKTKAIMSEARKVSAPLKGVTVKPDGKPGPELLMGRVFFGEGNASVALDAFPTSSMAVAEAPEGVKLRDGIYGLRAPTGRKDAEGREVWVNIGRVEVKGNRLTFLFDAVPFSARALSDLRETLEEKKARRESESKTEVQEAPDFGPEDFPEDPLA